MSTIKVHTSHVRDAASSSRAASTRVMQATGQLTSAVAPALRGDIPEYGIIEATYRNLLTGLRASSNDLANTAGNLTSYAALADRNEAANEALIGRIHDLFGHVGKADADEEKGDEYGPSDSFLDAFKGEVELVSSYSEAQGRLFASRFRPQLPKVQFTTASGPWSTTFLGGNSTSFTGRLAENYAARSAAYADQLKYLERPGKVLGPLGYTIEGTESFFTQLHEDQGKGYSKAKLGTRAATVAGSQVAGSALVGSAAMTGAGMIAIAFVPGVGEVAIVVVGVGMVGAWAGGEGGKALGKQLAKATGEMADGTVYVVTGTISGAKKAGGAIKDGTKAAASNIKDFGDDAGDGAASAAKHVAHAAKDAGDTVKDGTVQAANAAKNTAEEAGGAVKDGTVDAAHAVSGTASNIGHDAAHGAQAAGSKAAGGIKRAAGYIPGWR